jgi:hypothetical protein
LAIAAAKNVPDLYFTGSLIGRADQPDADVRFGTDYTVHGFGVSPHFLGEGLFVLSASMAGPDQ